VTTLVDGAALIAAGNAALGRGDAAGAREHFARASTSAPADPAAWYGLAFCCRALKDEPGANAAIDRSLALNPRNFRALIFKGDLYAQASDSRAAASYYRSALRLAPPRHQLPPHLLNELARAQQMCERYAREYEDFLVARLAAKGFDPGKSSRRFVQSFEMSMGRKQPYVQLPSQFYFPELPQIQFYERELFPWMDEVEQATDAIVAELHNVMTDANAFHPYVERALHRPTLDNDTMTENLDWAAFFLWKDGEIVPENAARCPETLRALENVPQCLIAHRTPSILFSRLLPGARIPPHNGAINARLICHLPLIVPPACGFRVGNDSRAWEKGKAWIFDDTIEHEAWNNSRETRVILIFEIWRPELTDEERGLVGTMLEAIDAYERHRMSWGD
jgi:aspartyl/asparaginyl beta-hydroxylase (cupin superfamily)